MNADALKELTKLADEIGSVPHLTETRVDWERRIRAVLQAEQKRHRRRESPCL